MVYAYLKEELVNTPCSHEVTHLKQKFANLVKFVDFIDEALELPYLKLHKSDQNKLNNLVTDEAEIRKIKKEKLNQFYEYKDLFCKQQQAFGILPVPKFVAKLLVGNIQNEVSDKEYDGKIWDMEKIMPENEKVNSIYAGVFFAIVCSYLNFLPNPF